MGVALVLRANGGLDQCDGWDETVQAIGSDPRIVVLPGTMRREVSLGLMAACDCFISPHRAEGFGRNIAEAILLGVPVLATAFSACMDFLDAKERIRWVPAAVSDKEYPFAEGLWWADPSASDLSRLMRSMLTRSSRDVDVSRDGRLRSTFDPTQVGERYKRRLKAIIRRLGRGIETKSELST
jgi:glycosyltransferase involved in cell wall biosynthesis